MRTCGPCAADFTTTPAIVACSVCSLGLCGHHAVERIIDDAHPGSCPRCGLAFNADLDVIQLLERYVAGTRAVPNLYVAAAKPVRDLLAELHAHPGISDEQVRKVSAVARARKRHAVTRRAEVAMSA